MSVREPADSSAFEDASGKSPRQSIARFFCYVGLIWALLLVPDFALRWSLNQVFPSWTDYDGLRRQPSLSAKVAQYAAERNDYDVVFTGDSRTFTDISPDAIDAILGTRSVNLATWGNWFPTQYASNQDFLPLVPDGVPVVWSIGHINFRQINKDLNLIYQLGFANVPTFFGWGFSLSQLRMNLLEGVPGLALYTRRAYIREHAQRILARRLQQEPAPETTPEAPSNTTYHALTASLESDPRVLDVDVIRSEGIATSIATFNRAGNYVRYEIDSDFFRSKQRELAQEIETISADRFEPEARYWNNFIGILDQYAEYEINLIINEFEEAPFHYEDPKNRRLYREFMDEVRALVEARGIPFIRVDFSRLRDEHYFDYNHLNSEGVEVFTEMFSKELSTYVDGD